MKEFLVVFLLTFYSLENSRMIHQASLPSLPMASFVHPVQGQIVY